MQAQVGIVGAGPAGLTLALLLNQVGIDCLVVEKHSRDHVEQRVRAGLLEHNTVELLRGLGVSGRLDREGLDHTGVYIRFQDRQFHIDMLRLTGRKVTVYGQQEVVKDEIAALLQRGVRVLFEVADTAVHDVQSTPHLTFSHSGRQHDVRCDFIVGCDGFHGVCRPSIPADAIDELEYVYPFSWLGVLAHARPSTDELIYASHDRGFALHSMRSPTVSRLYLQVRNDECIEGWPDARVRDELEVRLGKVNRGEIFDKGVTPIRSFVATPLQYGRLYLAGDAAHIVPPTGAKGLNLAVNDVRLLHAALRAHYQRGDDTLLARYTDVALRRVWRAEEFSNYMTQLFHDLGLGEFQRSLQLSRLEYLCRSEAAARSLAENYVGLPAEPDF